MEVNDELLQLQPFTDHIMYYDLLMTMQSKNITLLTEAINLVVSD